MMETLELWKSLLLKMSTNPKVYELSPYSKLAVFILVYFIPTYKSNIYYYFSHLYTRVDRCIGFCYIM